MQTVDRPTLTADEKRVWALVETARKQFGAYEAFQGHLSLPPLDQDEAEDYSSYDYRRPLTLTFSV